MTSKEKKNELERIANIVIKYFSSWDVKTESYGTSFPEWIKRVTIDNISYIRWPIVTREKECIYLDDVDRAVERLKDGRYVPFTKAELRFLDSQSIRLTNRHTQVINQRVEDWIYEE